jgi:glycosyltransferase involved in cell wall biosynthesis
MAHGAGLMLVYIYAEHYPNPYKPQFDTEFAYLLRQGHEVRIFAAGQYTSTIHPRVREYGLDRLTSLFPTTLRTLPSFAGAILARVARHPLASARAARAAWLPGGTVKGNVMRVARALVLPLRAPDANYIHNIATAEHLDFLHRLHPGARLTHYFHGGEVGGVKRVARDAELLAGFEMNLTNSGFSRRQTIERGCPPEKVVVVPVGFDLGDYPVTDDRPYRPDGILRLVSVGRLGEEKGLIHALHAVRDVVREGRIPLRYTLVGRGLLEDALKEFVATNGLAQVVEFAGEQDKAGVVRQLAASDVLVLPSLVTPTWAETQAAVVQEAMFMRALVIGTRTGGVPENTADELRQFSVEPADPDAIAAMIRRIAALPETEMRRLGDAGREFAVAKYSIEVTGRELARHVLGRT